MRILLISLIGAVALVVVIALVAVFVQRDPAQLDATTPEGVVQRYVQAVIAGDTDTAVSYLAPDVAAECELVPLDTQDRRVTLTAPTTQRADSATVEVLIVTVYGSGPLGSDEYESEGAFDLVRTDDAWAIRTAPWEFAVCTETGRG